MSHIISVIVPVYNVEKYLVRCVESILNQTYKNLEIILIDDGSKDSSPKLCDILAAKDSRIKVIKKDNGGASSARNIGIKNAVGDYIGFVDSDDYIEKDMYRSLLDKIIHYNADIAVCGFNVVGTEKVLNQCSYSLEDKVFDNKEGMANLFNPDYKSRFDVAVWNKLFKKEIFLDIEFEEGRTCEDTLIAPLLFAKAKKTVHVKGIYYNYFMSEESVTRQSFSDKNFDYIYAGKANIPLIKENYPELLFTAYCKYFSTFWVTMSSYLKYYGIKKKHHFDRLKIELNELITNAKNDNIYSGEIKKNSFKAKFVIKLPFLFVILKKIFKKEI